MYALSVIEDDKAWYIEHRFLSTDRAKAVTAASTTVAGRCDRMPRRWSTVRDPEQLRYAEMLHPENLPH
ncbi:putative acyl-CoA oxidase domain protein [Mycobacterium xenopi 3993]|nr:putative acyl-CoA oxidase domain protein [Mycobacterium xenopi 3993]